jgi:hypothetical protein
MSGGRAGERGRIADSGFHFEMNGWCGARFLAGYFTRGCHWIPRMFA